MRWYCCSSEIQKINGLSVLKYAIPQNAIMRMPSCSIRIPDSRPVSPFVYPTPARIFACPFSSIRFSVRFLPSCLLFVCVSPFRPQSLNPTGVFRQESHLNPAENSPAEVLSESRRRLSDRDFV